MSFVRAGYFIGYFAASACLIYWWISGSAYLHISDEKSLMLGIMCLTLYISKFDKPFLKQSIPLRVAGGFAGIVGLTVLLIFVIPVDLA